ncbi:MAG: DUF4492 domain-containing protein [Muribaculaceae bacterium]|nr:DUF4492 domain-containing protein [Muribaculaceae bacterium]
MTKRTNIATRIVRFYADGFRNMTIGRTLWAIIIVKLVVLFAVLKLFFFPDILASGYDSDEARAGAVRQALTTSKTKESIQIPRP